MKNQVLMVLKRVKPAYWIMIGMALSGMVIVYKSTPWGVLVDADSYFYLSAAKNLISGFGLGRLTQQGQWIPLTHYPPLYSLLVAVFSLFTHGNVLFSARIIACLLFGGNSLLFGSLLSKYTGSAWAGAAGTLLFLVSSVTLDVIVAGLSEGLFFMFLFLALYSEAEFSPGKGKAWFVGLCTFTSSASLTRYVGLAVVLACLVGIIAFNQLSLRNKFKAALTFGSVSLIPIGLWYLRDWLLTGSTTNRTIVYHWPGWTAWNEAVLTFTGWFLPFSVSMREGELFILGIFLVVLAGLGAWWLHPKWQKPIQVQGSATRFVWILASFILAYCLGLLVSRTFMDASTHWETRILSPLYLAGELFFFIVIWHGFQVPRHFWGKLLLASIGIYLVWLNLPQSIAYLKDYKINGKGLTEVAMQTSPVMPVINSLPSGGFIFSNNAAAIYFNTGKLGDWIPEKYDSVKALPRPDYPQSLAEMRDNLLKPGSLLVIFKPYWNHPEYPSLDELTQGLIILKDFTGATLYVHQPN